MNNVTLGTLLGGTPLCLERDYCMVSWFPSWPAVYKETIIISSYLFLIYDEFPWDFRDSPESKFPFPISICLWAWTRACQFPNLPFQTLVQKSVWQMAIQAREAGSGSGRPASVQTASAEQLTPLQPFLYNIYQYYFTWTILTTLFYDFLFSLYSWHPRDICDSLVTPCCATCGTEARIPAQRGRSFRRRGRWSRWWPVNRLERTSSTFILLKLAAPV